MSVKIIRHRYFTQQNYRARLDIFVTAYSAVVEAKRRLYVHFQEYFRATYMTGPFVTILDRSDECEIDALPDIRQTRPFMRGLTNEKRFLVTTELSFGAIV